eukprot:TRINITY_DN8301_c0_g1_i4.p1 TRINITY_DN8301_c0_g1~~TRINITY_DN8301_c0_g1_i4.p1  ORF type:complete len:443 (+),score=45.00 TRINITY_DN8301_c0_g1_i4:37-1365(+)
MAKAVLLLAIFAGVVAIDPRCQGQLNAWCSNAKLNGGCMDAMRKGGFSTSLIALNDTDVHRGPDQWRCYSDSSLNCNRTSYSNGTAYCTRPELVQILAECESNTTFVDVFTPGELGYPCIRIPSIVLAGNSTLIAMAECRNWTGDGCNPRGFEGDKYSVERNSNRDLCIKTSQDGGKTWSSLNVVARNAMQPNLVWNGGQQQVLLNFNQVTPGDTLTMTSKDMGRSWSEPASIGDSLGRFHSADVGPGVGIQLSPSNPAAPGRILFIAHNGAYVEDAVWYSDDNGRTFTVANTSFLHMDEAQLVELPDGRVLANMRNDHLTDCDCRGVSISTDGGASFGPVTFDPILISPVCMASTLRGADGYVYFANPASKSGRVNGMLRRARDGLTFNESKVVWPGQYAYSCLSQVSERDKIGLLFETGGMDTCTGESCRTVFTVLSTEF